MIKVELIYNPYIMDTVVKFNGHAPRINSLVEKYDKLMLQAWIQQIPTIFHDEMNGYDFELEYSGPELDFQELKASFANAGVSDKQVRLFWKNEMDSREVKVQKLENLLEWLKSHRNRKFDLDSFIKDNEDLLEGFYPFIVMHGNAEVTPELEKLGVSIENIDNIIELEKTVLSNTPIVHCIKKDSLDLLQKDIQYLMGRKDVIEEQLFFYIDTELDVSIVDRILRDLGIKAPQIVTAIDNDCIIHYLKVYPISDYIYSLLRTLRTKVDSLSETAKKESEDAMLANKEIYEQIDTIDKELEALKVSLSLFEQRDNLNTWSSMDMIKQELLERIFSWRNKKTKITNADEALRVAREFNIDAQHFYNEYIVNVENEMISIKEGIVAEYKGWYDQAGTEIEYVPTVKAINTLEKHELGYLVDALMGMKHEQLVAPKEDFLGLFFRAQNNEPKYPVLEQTWYYQEWREFIVEKVKQVAEPTPAEAVEIIRTYSEELALHYIKYLKKTIEEKTAEKIEIASRLSEDERILQIDNDWFAELIDKISEIERA